MTFKEFHEKYNYLTIDETIEFYSIFEGHPFLEYLSFDGTLEDAIKEHIIQRVTELKPYFIFDENSEFQKDLESILHRLAIGDRKVYTIYKKENISQLRGRMLFKTLFEKKIIKKEKSRELPKREFKGQLIKKSLRRYEIQDKIHFRNNFTRFWFNFIYPYDKNEEQIFLHVNNFLEQFLSLSFEELSIELTIKLLGEENIVEAGSYWDKDREIDLLIETQDGTMIAGESKWKNHRISKKTLNHLVSKCQKAYFDANEYLLFSKSGFTKELLSLKNLPVKLYSLEDFKALYD